MDDADHRQDNWWTAGTPGLYDRDGRERDAG